MWFTGRRVLLIAETPTVKWTSVNHVWVDRVALIEIPTDDSWLRDTGPVFLKSKSVHAELGTVNFGFNAWGGKYPSWDADAAVAGTATAARQRTLEQPERREAPQDGPGGGVESVKFPGLQFDVMLH